MQQISRRWGVAVALVGGVGLGGCGGEGTLRIDSALADSAALAGAERFGSTIALEAATGTLTLERARVAVGEIELEGEEEDDDEEFETGPEVVEIALDSTATEIVAEAVPAGTYAELGLELMLADDGDGAAFADFAGGSIVVDGTYDGEPFAYRSSTAPELEFELVDPAEVVEGGEARVAVTFDVAAWFLGPDGVALDPADPASRATIESNILGSMAAVAEVELADDDHVGPEAETSGELAVVSAELEADAPKPKKCSVAGGTPGMRVPRDVSAWLLPSLLFGTLALRRRRQAHRRRAA